MGRGCAKGNLISGSSGSSSSSSSVGVTTSQADGRQFVNHSKYIVKPVENVKYFTLRAHSHWLCFVVKGENVTSA